MVRYYYEEWVEGIILRYIRGRKTPKWNPSLKWVSGCLRGAVASRMLSSLEVSKIIASLLSGASPGRRKRLNALKRQWRSKGKRN